MMNDSCYYAVLGISSNSSLEEIKAAYHDKARKYHPDKQSLLARQQSNSNCGGNNRRKFSTDLSSDQTNNAHYRCQGDNCNNHEGVRNNTSNKYSETTKTTATITFHEIQQAWECLSNPHRRAEYDQQQRQLEQMQQQRRSSAIRLQWSDCEYVIPEDEDDDDEQQQEEVEEKGLPVLVYTCRCGCTFGLLPEEDETDDGGDEKTDGIHPDSSHNYSNQNDPNHWIVECPNCSIKYDTKDAVTTAAKVNLGTTRTNQIL